MADIANVMNYASIAWNRAWEQGYVSDSIAYHAGQDFLQVAGGAIVGAAAGLAVVFIGQMGGAAAGAALGAYISAGNPVVAIAVGQLGAQVGRTVAVAGLTVLGIAFLVEYVGEHVADCAANLLCAYDALVNQADQFFGPAQALIIDMAARQIAESIGVFCGLIVGAIVMYMTYRLIAAKTAGQTKPNLIELVESKFNKMSNGLIDWIAPRLSELRQKPRGGGLRLIQGGLASDTMTPLTAAMRTAKTVLPRLVDPVTNMMKVSTLAEVARILREEGFTLIKAEPYGPPGGYQFFWSKGNVLARFKTLGESRGPRASRPHLSLGFNDGRGLDFVNDIGKFNANGKILAKVVSNPETFQTRDFQGNPQKFVLLPTNFEVAAVDAWANQVHWNAPAGFNAAGAAELAATAVNAPPKTMPLKANAAVLGVGRPPRRQ